MFFQISPVRRSIKKASKPNTFNESEEITELSLAPFTANPKLSFEDVPVNSISSRKLLIKNPHNYDVQLNIYHNIPDDMNVSLNWNIHELRANTETMLEIVWSPQCEGNWRFSLTIEGSRRIQRVVPVAFKSMSTKVKKKKKPNPNTKQSKVTYLSRKISPAKKSSVQKMKSSTIFAAPSAGKNNVPAITICTPNDSKHHKADKENMNNAPDSSIFVSPSNASFHFEMTKTVERRDTYTLRTDYMPSNILTSSTLHNITSKVDKTKHNSYVDSNRDYISDCSFNDSLEMPKVNHFEEKLPHDQTDCINTPIFSANILNRLQSESFTISPVAIPKQHVNLTHLDSTNSTNIFHHPYNITQNIFPHTDVMNRNITYDMEQCSTKPCNLSTETYVKGNLSSETYTKADITGGTYVKDNSLTDLTTLSVSPISSKYLSDNMCKTMKDSNYHFYLDRNRYSPVHERNQTVSANDTESNFDNRITTQGMENSLSNFPSHKLGSIVEESFSIIENENVKKPLKRPSTNSFSFVSPKRPNIETPRRSKLANSSWAKKPVSIKMSKRTSGISLQHAKSNFYHTSTEAMMTVTDTRQVTINNPFILAATTMIDPFMTLDIYVDQPWVEEQEINFKKWLNALLTPPEELDSDIEGPAVNVAKLWQQCKTKDVAEAPTKEAISHNYHTSARLNSLRRTARALYMSGEISNVLSKVVSTVETGKLMIRKDRNVHLDLGLQAETMSLLLSYNPLWLRIGLETIYNQQIPLHSNSDVMGLSTFIMTRFFKDPHLLKKHKSIHAPKYVQDLKKHILKKYLILVYFLDQAKTKKLIAHDPCLFCKNAPVKESREMLIRFARDTISSIGDITKYLKLFGYIVIHKQTYINEFDYAVKNLGADLRDGVRLTRVMEIILLEAGLTNKLRVPAISILQKVHNTKLAFDALEKAGYQILQDITPKDLVDGHREKTLSFLWQIIYKFEAPLMVKSVTTIQNWWRSLGVSLKRNKLRRTRMQRENAAKKIQTWYQNQKIARKLQELRNWLMAYIYNRKREIAATKIQAYFRMHVHRKMYICIKSTTIRIQSYARRWLFNHHYKQRICAAILIQSFIRMCLAKNQFIKYKRAALIIQSHYIAYKLMKVEHTRYKSLKSAVLCIENKYKANQLMKHEHGIYLSKKQAAITIQRRYRANKLMQQELQTYSTIKCAVHSIQTWYKSVKLMQNCRTYYLKLKKSVQTVEDYYLANKQMLQELERFQNIKKSTVIIQHRYRAHKVMKCQRDYFLKLKTATIVIQQRYRAKKECEAQRHNYLKLKKYVTICQRRFRANRLMKIRMINYRDLKRAATVIQTRFKANQVMKKQFETFQIMKMSVIKIQKYYRAWLLMKKQKQKYCKLKATTMRIQELYRAKLSMRQAKANYAKLKLATLIIQQHFKAHLLMIKQRKQFTVLKNAVLCIQRRYRARLEMKLHQVRFTQLKTAAIVIQRCFRATVLMKIQREYYLSIRNAVIVVQRSYRAKCYMKRERLNYTQLKNSAIVLQRRFRAQCLRRTALSEYQVLRKTVLRIQTLYRAKIQMKSEKASFTKLKHAVIVIQERFRANRLRKLHMDNFKSVRNAAITIQRRFRAQKSMRINRHEYLLIKRSVITVQRLYRAKAQMIIDKTAYNKLKTATIIIQRRYKATCAMRAQLYHYINLKNVTIVIQRRYRARHLKTIAYNEYRTLKATVLKIQRLFRAKLQMRQMKTSYDQLKNSTLIIQRRFRARRLMRIEIYNYRRLKNAAVAIQRRFKAKKLMQSDFKHYQTLKANVLKIQFRYRAKIQMRLETNAYNKLKYYTVAMQRRFRANKLMKKERMHYVVLLQATLMIQRRLRMTLLAKQQRQMYIRLRRAAILIQRKYRSTCLMKLERQRFLLIKKSVYIIQQKLRAFMISKNAMLHYNKLKSAVVFIQRRHRANLFMKRTRNDYLKLKGATRTIQRWFRARKQMQQDVKAYQKLRYYTIKIQQKFRSKQMMHKARDTFKHYKHSVLVIEQRFIEYKNTIRIRHEFVKIKSAAFKIQNYYRNYTLMKTQRQKFLSLKKSTVIIQRRYRARILMRQERTQFLLVRQSAVSIQRYFRNYLLMKEEHATFLKKKNIALNIQPYLRGYLIRKKYAAMLSTEAKEQRREKRLRNQAIIKIQALWRGHRSRSLEDPKLVMIRQRTKEACSKALPEDTLGHRCGQAVQLLITENVTLLQILKVLQDLEYITRRCRNSCIQLSKAFPEQLYLIIGSTSRSLPEMNACDLATHILINLCKYHQTTANSWVPEYMDQVVTVMMNWCDKESFLFSSLCTLLWLFAHNEEYKSVIRSIPNYQKRMAKIETLCMRKYKMVTKTGVKGVSVFGPYHHLQLPSLKPDWGLDLKNKPNTFTNSVHALHNLLLLLR